MLQTATRRRTRRAPAQSAALIDCCTHCGEFFEPGTTPVPGVCQHCVDTLYFRCDTCGSYFELSLAEETTSGRTICPSCADELTFVCADCGRRHENADHECFTDRDGRMICDGCATSYARCDCCGRLTRIRDMQLTDDGHMCWSCAAYEYGWPIRSYSFKPEPIFFDIEGGDCEGLYLGIELEMDNGDAEAAAKRILNSHAKALYFKHDGSLDDGCELVTHPMSPAYLMSDSGKAMWRDICASATAEGMRSHDTTTCGLHVHVSRSFFGKSKTAQELAEFKLIETVDRLFEPLIIFSRRKRRHIERWASKCNAPADDSSWAKKAKHVSEYAKRDRYRAVNVANASTIEFRLFRGTLKPETILATLQFVTGICHLAKALNPAQMQRLSWYDLADAVMDACPEDTTELYDYLVKRELIVEKGEPRCA